MGRRVSPRFKTFYTVCKRMLCHFRIQYIKLQDPKLFEVKCFIISAYYLFQWKEYSGSRGQDGELPLSQIDDVLLCECNPTKELLDAIKSTKNDGNI